MSEPVLDIRRPSPHVAEVWLNRPDVRNAFNDGVIAALTEAFARLNADAATAPVELAPTAPRRTEGIATLAATMLATDPLRAEARALLADSQRGAHAVLKLGGFGSALR